MNGTKKLPTIGIYRPRNRAPGFGIPVFSDESGPCVQEIGEDGRVLRFVPCDIDVGTLRNAETRRQSVGEPGLYAFEAGDGAMIVGSRASIEETLNKALPAPDILALILRGSWVSVNGFRPVLAARRGFFNFPRLPVSQASPSHRLRAAF